MSSLWIALIASIGCIVVLELVLWRIFSRNSKDLLLAHDHDASAFGLWTIGRLRIFAVIHTLLLLLSVSTFLLWIW